MIKVEQKSRDCTLIWSYLHIAGIDWVFCNLLFGRAQKRISCTLLGLADHLWLSLDETGLMMSVPNDHIQKKGLLFLAGIVFLLIFSWWVDTRIPFSPSVLLNCVGKTQELTILVPPGKGPPSQMKLLVEGHLDGPAQLTLGYLEGTVEPSQYNLEAGDVRLYVNGLWSESACNLRLVSPQPNHGRLTVHYRFKAE